MRSSKTIVFMTLFLLCVSSQRPWPAKAVQGHGSTANQSPVEIEARIFKAVNEVRKKHGLRPLKLSRKLQDMARLHSLDMANHHYMGHIDSRKQGLKKRAKNMHLVRWRALGENVVKTFGYKNNASVMVKEWLESEHHRRNILNPEYDSTGVGVVHDCGGYYYGTQLFMRSSK